MFNFKNFYKGIVGTIILALLIVFSNLIYFSINFYFLTYFFPLFIVTFLLVPYINKESVLLGGIIGLIIIYSIILRLELAIVIPASIIISLFLSFYSQLFIKEPENKKHILNNLFSMILNLIPVSYLLSVLNTLSNHSFLPSFLSMLFTNIIVVPIIVNLITYYYGVKINSFTVIFRELPSRAH
jgi:hypothetical protein